MSIDTNAPMEHKTKKPVKGFKYRLDPTPEQAQTLNKYLNDTRGLYNNLLGEHIDSYTAWKLDNTLPKPDASQYAMTAAATAMRRRINMLWLGAVPATILQQKAIDLASAFTNFFKKTNKNQGFPRFKKKGYGDSFRVTGTDSIRVSPDGVTIPLTKSPIKIRWSRDLPSAPSSYTITRTATGKYFISFVCEYIPDRRSGIGKIGIDVGLKDIVYLSNGKSIPNPKPFIKAQKHLAHLQRKLARCTLHSRNFHKLRIKVAKIYEYISNFRKDFLHKLSSILISENQAICVETLNVSGMIRNRHLAKHIMDAGFSFFRDLLMYKSKESSHTRLYLADPWYPSTQLCSSCGGLPSTKISLSIRKWTCEHCGAVHQRDFNASKNLENLMDSPKVKLMTLMDPNGRVIPIPRFSAV